MISNPSNEIQISSQSTANTYISRAIAILEGTSSVEGSVNDESKVDTSRVAIISATGPTIATAVTVAEIVKRRVRGVHQITRIEPRQVLVDKRQQQQRKDVVASISITLSTMPLDTTDPGYQAPLPDSEVVSQDDALQQQQQQQQPSTTEEKPLAEHQRHALAPGKPKKKTQ